jgi:HAD superfamily hydrolase (TIGR01549 family)
MIKGNAFDAGGVLLLTKDVNLKTARLLRKYFPEINYELYKNNFAKFKEKAQTVKDYSFKMAVEECLKSLGVDDERRIEKFIKMVARLRPKILLGCRELFEFIKRKNIKIIILSDTHHTSSSARRFFKHSSKKISELIDFIITSKDVGCKKPCPKIFRFACKRTGLKKEEILFISDSREEIFGAKIFGFKTIFFSNENKRNAFYIKSVIKKCI